MIVTPRASATPTSPSKQQGRPQAVCGEFEAEPVASSFTGHVIAGPSVRVWMPRERLGRYHILDRLGRGGMGLVYLAYDPILERRLAIKILLNHSREPAGERARREQRLQREARALARIDHPNIIQILDVGIHDGRVILPIDHATRPYAWTGEFADSLLERGHAQRAHAMHQLNLQGAQDSVHSAHIRIPEARRMLAGSLAALGDCERAREEIELALDLQRALVGPHNASLTRFYLSAERVFARCGRAEAQAHSLALAADGCDDGEQHLSYCAPGEGLVLQREWSSQTFTEETNVSSGTPWAKPMDIPPGKEGHLTR